MFSSRNFSLLNRNINTDLNRFMSHLIDEKMRNYLTPMGPIPIHSEHRRHQNQHCCGCSFSAFIVDWEQVFVHRVRAFLEKYSSTKILGKSCVISLEVQFF